jgi:hypothetical protein
MIHLYLRWRARRKLQRLVQASRNSFQTQQYRKHRDAALLGIARKRGAA